MRLLTCGWARRHTQVLVLEENGRPRSGMIVFKLPMRAGRRPLRVAGLAAVVTDPDHRARGLAAMLIQIAHRRLADAGYDHALLFTEIGTAFYERFGYRSWPLIHHQIEVPRTVIRLRGVEVRRAELSDVEAQKLLYDRFQEGFDLTLRRPLEYWRYLLARARWKHDYFASPGGSRFDPERWIGVYRGRPAAYARCLVRPDDLLLSDAAYAPGRAEVLAAIVGHRAREAGLSRVSVIAPPSVVRRLELPVVRSDSVEKMMIASLEPGRSAAPRLVPCEQCIWPEDWF
jgi:predicted acetyltransferase